MKKIIVATRNPGKMKEIEEIFKSNRYKIFSLDDIGFMVNIVEDQDSFKGNAIKKALSVVESIGEIALGDDSGLEVDELGGQPGIFSARFSGPDATDKENNEKLIRIMKSIPLDRRGAQFRCLMALVLPDGRQFIAEGICRGTIGYEAHGNMGFGYDPLFIPDGYTKTFAQIGEEHKNQISHRAIALRNIKSLVKNIF